MASSIRNIETWFDDSLFLDNNYDQTLLTNFRRADLPQYLRAIQLYEQQEQRIGLRISECAYDIYGGLLSNCCALYAPNQDMSAFWIIFDAIHKEYPRLWNRCYYIPEPISFINWYKQTHNISNNII